MVSASRATSISFSTLIPVSIPSSSHRKTRSSVQTLPAERQREQALAEARNAGDNKAYEVEKGITDHGDKLAEADKTALQERIQATREAVKSEDVKTIEAATDELAKLWMATAQKLYQQTPPPAAGDAPPTGDAPDADAKTKKPGDGAVDADFEVMN